MIPLKTSFRTGANALRQPMIRLAIGLPLAMASMSGSVFAQLNGEIQLPLTGDKIGVFSSAASYFRLTTRIPNQVRRFHYGHRLLPAKDPRPVAGDFNGNGKDSVGVFEPFNATWHLGNQNGQGKVLWSFQFGSPHQQAVTGNWDGLGGDGIGTYHAASGTFNLRNAVSAGSPDYSFQLLDKDDGSTLVDGFAVAGDFNGDGVDTVGLYDPEAGKFWLSNSAATSGASTHVANLEYEFGAQFPSGSEGTNARAVFGDWNDNGKDSPAVYDPENHSFKLGVGNPPSASFNASAGNDSAPVWWPVAGFWNKAGSTGEHSGFAWPEDGLQGMNPNLLDAALVEANSIANLHSLLICRNGYLVKEHYFHDFDATMANNTKSVSKSFLSALFGIGLEPGGVLTTQGTLGNLQDKVVTHLPGYVGPESPKNNITLNHITAMRSGLDVQTGGYGPFYSSSGDWMAYVLGKDLLQPPGSQFRYSLELTHLGYGVLQSAATKAALAINPLADPVYASEFAQDNLFGPLQMSFTRWDRDPHGVDAGGFFVRPRDMARFGQLYLEGGTLLNTATNQPETIFGASWVAESFSPITTGISITNAGNSTVTSVNYGRWWWGADFAGQSTYFAWGFGGQFIFVVPSRNLVVVATSEWASVSSQAIEDTNEGVFNLMENQIVPASIGD